MRNLESILLKELQYFCDSFCEKYQVSQGKFYQMLDYAVLEMQKVLKKERRIRREVCPIAGIDDLQTTQLWPVDMWSKHDC